MVAEIRRRAAVAGPDETHEHLRKGINLVADLLAPTLGPVSGHVVSDRDSSRGPEVLDDASTVVRRILSLGDPRLDVGAMLMRSLVWRVGKEIGDGGATAAVLARAIYNEALRLLTAGVNFRELEKGMHRAVESACQSIREQARPVSGEDALSHIAFGVVRDRRLANVLGEISYLLGPDARVNVQKYVAPYLEREFYPGANYKAEIASYLLYTEPVRKRAVHTNCAVALVDARLTEAADAAPLLEAAVKAGFKSLAIMANGFSDTALHVIVSNHENKKTIDVVAFKPKVVGEERRYALDDLALLTGATVLGRGFTPQPRSAKPEHLGKAIRVEVDAETVRMIPERQRAVAVQEEITAIREKLANMSHGEEERTVLVNRLSALTGGMATLKVGATSKHEREVQAQNAERALKVLSAAQIGGVVPGGGAALFHAGMDLNGSAGGGEAMGAQVIKSALAAPLRQMLVNAHVPAPGVVLEDLESAGPNAVYDILQRCIMDAEACGVLDAARVLENVLRMSASVAIMALSTDTIVYHRKPEQVMEP